MILIFLLLYWKFQILKETSEIWRPRKFELVSGHFTSNFRGRTVFGFSTKNWNSVGKLFRQFDKKDWKMLKIFKYQQFLSIGNKIWLLKKTFKYQISVEHNPLKMFNYLVLIFFLHSLIFLRIYYVNQFCIDKIWYLLEYQKYKTFNRTIE